MNNEYGHWDTSIVGEFNQEDWFGFIYLIINNSNNKSYIGKKNFRFTRRHPPLKGKKRRRTVITESDWKGYCSSSKYLKEDINKGEDKFLYVIVKLCSGKSELSYSEENYQHSCNVLTETLDSGERAYYNKTIANRHFAGLEKQSKESREKVSKSVKEYYKNNPKQAMKESTKKKLSKIQKDLRINEPGRIQCISSWINNLTTEERSEHCRQAAM